MVLRVDRCPWNPYITFVTTHQTMTDFYDYCLSFYGSDGIYDMNATLDMVIEATAKYLKEGSIPFDGDSVDRENVRDIMMRDYGLVPLEELAHKVS